MSICSDWLAGWLTSRESAVGARSLYWPGDTADQAPCQHPSTPFPALLQGPRYSMPYFWLTKLNFTIQGPKKVFPPVRGRTPLHSTRSAAPASCHVHASPPQRRPHPPACATPSEINPVTLHIHTALRMHKHA